MLINISHKLMRLKSAPSLKCHMSTVKATKLLTCTNKPNSYALIHLIRNCTNHGLISYTHQLHSYIIRSGFDSDVYISSALINFYIKFDSLNNAHKLFAENPYPNLVSWNTLISGFVKYGQCSTALRLFYELEISGIGADKYSLTAALSACGLLRFLGLGETIHAKIVKIGVECSVVVGNCLIDFYGKCGNYEEAKLVFYGMIEKDNISWNSVIAACARNNKIEQAFSFLHQMGDPDTLSYNEVINGLAQYGDIDDAFHVLMVMPNPNSSSWNSIITGFVNRGLAKQAMGLLCEMKVREIEMDQFTYSSILSGIASLSSLAWGLLIHCCTIKSGLDSTLVVGSAVIDMYSKCGQIHNAKSLFESLPRKNLVTWNAMISGFAHNGDSAMVIKLFEELKASTTIKPDEITFLNVLSACSHSELSVQVGMDYMESMVKDYELEPSLEHCCCMIRLMGRRGEVFKAVKLIYELGFGWCGLVWKTFLGACGACWELKVAEAAAANVVKLDGDNEYVYVILSNLNALCGKWGDAGYMRARMSDRGVRKEVGRSWIEA